MGSIDKPNHFGVKVRTRQSSMTLDGFPYPIVCALVCCEVVGCRGDDLSTVKRRNIPKISQDNADRCITHGVIEKLSRQRRALAVREDSATAA